MPRLGTSQLSDRHPVRVEEHRGREIYCQILAKSRIVCAVSLRPIKPR